MNTPISEIMTAQVKTVDINKHNLQDAKAIFAKEKVRHLPVVDGHRLCGIISKNDMNRLTFGAMFESQIDADEAVLEMLSIEQVMTAHPRVVQLEATVKEVAEIFVKEDFHSLPVIHEDQLMGIVTTTDIIRHILSRVCSETQKN